MLNLNCFTPSRQKSSSEGIIAWVHGRKVGESLLSSFLFLCPKTVANKSEIFVCCTLNFRNRDCIQLRFQAETFAMGLSRLISPTCIWDGTISPLTHLDIAHLSLLANYCDSCV